MRNFYILVLLACSAIARFPANAESACSSPFTECQKLDSRTQRVFDRDEILQNLILLYPHFSKEFLNERLRKIKNPFMFFRSFVAYFYKDVETHFLSDQRLEKINSFLGLAAGDSHLENYGVLITESGSARIVINDPDDSGIIPLYLDYIRHLSSVFLSLKKMKTNMSQHFFINYENGLLGKDYIFSNYVQNLLKEGAEMGKKPAANDYHEDRLVLNQSGLNASPLDQEEERGFSQFIKAQFGKDTMIYDHLKFVNLKSGGSSGLTRFRFLIIPSVRIAGVSMGLQIIEFKELGPSGAEELSSLKIDPIERIERTLAHEQGEKNFFWGGVEILGRPYYFRPLWLGNKKITFKNIPLPELRKVVFDELYQLGRFHSTILNAEVGNYLSELKKIGPDVLADLSHFISVLMKSHFEQSR